MALYRVFCQLLQAAPVATRGKDLKGTDPQVAGGHPGQHRAGQRGFTPHGFAGAHHRQRPRGGNAQRVHRLAHHIFTQHRPQPGAPVAAARIGRAPGPLELDIAALPVGADGFAQQHGAPVAQLRVVLAELVPGIQLGKRLGPVRQGVAAKDKRHLGCIPPGDPQQPGQIVVERQKARRTHRNRGLAGIEHLGQAGIAVVKRDIQGHVANIGPMGANAIAGRLQKKETRDDSGGNHRPSEA